MALVTQRSTDDRADALSTPREILATFVRYRSPQILLTGAFVMLFVRLAVGGWTWVDAAVVATTIVLTGPIEWVLHLVLLHAPEDSVRMRKLGTGTGHREHHLDPHDVGWILLGGIDAFVFQWMLFGFTALWVLPTALVFDLPLLAPFLTGVTAAWITLAHYEWVHLLVHTRYRPKSRYYKRLARNHRLHHYRNERHWLGVTSNLGDRVLRTLPENKSDVPRSETARTLG